MESIAVKALTEGSLVIGFGVAGILLLFFIVKHILKQQEKILDMATIQNTNWQKALDEHTAQASKFHEQVSDAHKYQREEHIESSKNIASLCSSITTMDEKDKLFRAYVTENLEVRRKQQEQITENLDQIAICLKNISRNLESQGVVLTRINGYSHTGADGIQGIQGEKGNRGERGAKGVHG